MTERTPGSTAVVRSPSRLARRATRALLDLFAAGPMLVWALASRWLAPRSVDVGIGPEPLVSARYHQGALARHGVSAESYVDRVYFITDDFDVRFDRLLRGPLRALSGYAMFTWATWRYRCLFLYFSGGPLSRQPLLQWLEPALLRAAGVRIVMLAYGSDVQILDRSPNPAFRTAVEQDYPAHRQRERTIARKIDHWTRTADHVVSGCEWVDYMPRWDTLMLLHFPIDPAAWPATPPPAAADPSRPLRILHAPNHRAIKGTRHFEAAVESLRAQGMDIELVLLTGVSNDRIHEVMREVDVVADQLIIGWYAMFALEGMAMGKAVLCYLRPDLLELYESAGIVRPDEIPIVNCEPATVEEAIRRLYSDRELLGARAARGPEFVRRHHSEEVVGAELARIVEEVTR